MSLALYRTYRPARLADVVGQEHITAPLTRALENDRVHHAYLFSGPRGCGKTSTARIMARSLNCEQGPTPEPCGECQSCIDLAAGGPGSIDVIELDAASHGGVDDTRDLRERAMFAPASSRYKVYIIDEAHMVSTAGFNALLKLVEEPPEHVRFIFATTDPDKVLPTIRSRTHNYAFRLVGTKELQHHLASICEQEGVPAEPAALALVARAGAGSVRDSLSILGQVIAGSGPDGITYAEVADQLGVTDTALLDATLEAISARDGAALFQVIESVVDAGHDPRRFVSDLLERMRDVIVVQSVPDAAGSGLIDAPDDEVERIVQQAKVLGPAEASRTADVVSATLSELKGATAPRLRLEMMAARLLVPAADDSDDGSRARLEHLERVVAALPVSGGTGAAEPAVKPAEDKSAKQPSKKAESTAAKPNSEEEGSSSKAPAPPRISEVAPSTATESSVEATTSDVTLEGFVSMWPAVMDALAGYGRVPWMAFSGSRPLSWSDDTLAVGLDSPGKVANVANSGHGDAMQAAIKDVLKVEVRLDVVLASEATTSSSAGTTASTTPAKDADAPSLDDADVDDVTGVDLVMRELGGVQIGEIEH
jgi:DNA polymerase-3 subunit gamma/tau